MTFQVLVSTMYQTDYSILDKMNILSDAVIVNQCDKNKIEEFMFKGHNIKWISTTDRGVGKSRNLAIDNSSADILLFADDDVVYDDDYEKKIKKLYSENPDLDLVVFNFVSKNKNRIEKIVDKDYRLKWYNSLKFGAFRISVRRKFLISHNLRYSLLFGGGAQYQAGEDNLFIIDSLKAGAKGLASHIKLGIVKQEDSTWFHGYNEKYYKDRGALFCAMFGKKSNLILLLFEMKGITHKREINFLNRMKFQRIGITEYKNKVEARG